MILKLTKDYRQMLANINPPPGFMYAGSASIVFINDNFQPIENDVHIKIKTDSDDIEISLHDPITYETVLYGTEIDVDLSAEHFQYGCMLLSLITKKIQHVRLYTELTYNGEVIKAQIESNFIDPKNQASGPNCMFDVYQTSTILTPDKNSFPVNHVGLLEYEYDDQGGKKTTLRTILDNGALFEKGEDTVTYTDSFTIQTNQGVLTENVKVQLPDYGLYTLSTKLEGVSPVSLDKTIVNEACILVINVKKDKQLISGKLCSTPSGIITHKKC